MAQSRPALFPSPCSPQKNACCHLGLAALSRPRIEPFIRPRLQGGTHRARSTKPNSSSPDWGKRRLKPQSVEGIPQCCHFSRAPQRSRSSPHISPIHQNRSIPHPVEQPIRSRREGRPHVQIPPSRPFERVRGRRRGGNDQSSARCLAVHLGTPVGNWDWEGRSFFEIGVRS